MRAVGRSCHCQPAVYGFRVQFGNTHASTLTAAVDPSCQNRRAFQASLSLYWNKAMLCPYGSRQVRVHGSVCCGMKSSASGLLSIRTTSIPGSELMEQPLIIVATGSSGAVTHCYSPESSLPNSAWGCWSGDRVVFIGDCTAYSNGVPSSVT